MSGLYNLIDYAPTTLSKNITDFLTNYGRKKTYSKGSILANEGEMSRSVYIILEGSAEILKEDGNGNQNVIAQVGQGTIIGEMGVFLDQKRTGTIRSDSELIVLEFSNDNFLNALSRIPELSFRLFKSLSTKIVKGNETLVHQSSNQCLLTMGIAMLEMKPVNLRSHLGQITVHPSQVSKETGIERKTIRNMIEQFKNKRIVTAASVTYDGSIMLTVDFERLGKYCKALVNKGGEIIETSVPSRDTKKPSDKVPLAKKQIRPPSTEQKYELAARRKMVV
jgi:CRP/FNR family cyclic AMP-dependent transcriptional regulator